MINWIRGGRRRMRFVMILSVAVTVGGLVAAALLTFTTLRVLTGFVSHTLCSEAFVSGLDPASVYAEALAPIPTVRQLAFAITYHVDLDAALVTSSVAGIATSGAVYRGIAGCSIADNPSTVGHVHAAPNRIVEPRPLPAATLSSAQRAVIDAAIDRAFLENASPPYRNTKAVVVLRDGQLVAERYAPGVTAATPLLGWSVAKTIVNALVGILVRDGRISLRAAAPVPEWSSPDARRSITIEQLLRMTSGLALDESHSGRDPSSKILFLSSDVGRDAVSARLMAEPGRRWSYSSGSYLILSRIIRDAVGGTDDAVRRFASRELFSPLGMAGVTMETDSVGTPIGSSFVLATARDWARFGALYTTDGVAGGRRILPAGWVSTSATPTLNTGYGAGLWTNVRTGRSIDGNKLWSMPNVPTETLSARGLLGQFIVMVPSQRLVVVRFGHAHTPDADMERVGDLVKDVLAALALAT